MTAEMATGLQNSNSQPGVTMALWASKTRCLGTSTLKIAIKNILPFMTSFIVTLLFS